MIVYFSNLSNNTHRFVDKLGFESYRIPIVGKEYQQISENYLLVFPTYGNGKVPGQITRFLRQSDLSLMKGIVGSGNTNFGATYALGATKVSYGLNVPLLHKFELMGNQEDIDIVRNIYNERITNRVKRAA